MRDQIQKVVEVSIAEGKLGEFKEVAARFIERVEASEPNTLRYEWFLSEDGGKCYILELYKDSEALWSHLANIRDLYAPLFELAQITRIEVFGAASEGVKNAHIPGTVFYDYWAGTTR
jgi:quinol monooxygenase YgiN